MSVNNHVDVVGGILRHYTLKGDADPEAIACNNMVLK